jgi:flagellar hook-associated protein 1 FlgK
MSLSGALSNAMSGLIANARATTVISSNVANALNENYGRRDVSLSANATQTSGGVIVAQVTRNADPILAFQKRMARADHSATSALATFQKDLEQLIGGIDTTGSLADKLTAFQSALLSAEADPSSQTRLRNVSFAADAFASGLRAASDGIVALRTNSDANIGKSIDDMNAGLEQLQQLNERIMTARHLGQDVHGLLDQRDATLESLSGFVPLHVVERDSGAIAVFTTQGRTLLDDRAVKLEFNPTPTVLPHMSVSNGLLSKITVDGKPMDIPGSAMMDGGGLGALFTIRDVTAPLASSQLDAIARDVIERFGPGGPDPTLAAGAPGVFTDAGAPLDPAASFGLAGRISLNTVLSSSGHETWRWRDGIYATAPGDVGQGALLVGLSEEIENARVAGSLVLGTGPQSLTNHFQKLSSDISANRTRLIDAKGQADDRLQSLRQAAAAEGVNTDQELQKLIELEKSYAANARVVRVVDEMLSELLRI